MTEADEDLRASTLVLVSHSLLNGRGRLRASGALVDWAHRNGWGVYQLPEPSHLFDPVGATLPARLDEDRSQLDFVFSQLHTYVANGYSLVGLALESSEIDGELGRAWLAQVVESAAAAGVPLGATWLVPADQDGWQTPPEADLATFVPTVAP